MHLRRFYLSPSSIFKYSEITGSEAIYMIRVLRMSIGEYVEIFDGCGMQYISKIIKISRETVRVKMLSKSRTNKESNISISIAQASLKDKKMDVLIRQLTELGVAKWIVFTSNRSIPISYKKRMVSKIERWIRISISAVKQSLRGIIPEIHFIDSFQEILNFSESYDSSIIFWEGDVSSTNFQSLYSIDSNLKNILLIIGPEGGFDVSELEEAKKRGVLIATLGPRILRAETASIAACSIIQYLFGDMGKKNLTT